MASNSEELSAIYKQISVLEIIEKVKGKGIVWSQITPYQFRSEFAMGSDYWDIYITRMPSASIITLDFVKNLRPFYSIDSDAEPFVEELFDEANSDEDYCRDKELLADIQSAEGCGPRTFNVLLTAAGLLANSGARMRHFYIPQDTVPSGVYISGEHESKDNIMSFAPSGGVRVSGGFTSFDNIHNITPTGGVRCAGAVSGGARYDETVDPAGVVVAGQANILQTVNVAAAGVLAAGRGTFTYNDVVAAAGVLAGGQALNIFTYDVTSAGVYAGGTVLKDAYVVADGVALNTERYTVTTTGVGLLASSPVSNITVRAHHRLHSGPGAGFSASFPLNLSAGTYMAVVLCSVEGSETVDLDWDFAPMTMITSAAADWTGFGFNASTAIGYIQFVSTGVSSTYNLNFIIGSPTNNSKKASIFTIEGLSDYAWTDTFGTVDLASSAVTYGSTLNRSNVGVCSVTYTADSTTGTWSNGFTSDNVFAPTLGPTASFSQGRKSIGDSSSDIFPTVSFTTNEDWLNHGVAFS